MDPDAEEVLTRPALEALYTRLEKPLFNVLYHWVWDAEEAHDLVQESFLRLWKMRGRVKMETVEPLAYRIGCNLAANRIRTRKLWRMANLEAARAYISPARGPEHRLEQSQKRDAVKSAVLALPERLRRVVMLCEYSGMSYKEIAEGLQIPEGTVGSRRSAAMKRLRSDLAPLMEQ